MTINNQIKTTLIKKNQSQHSIFHHIINKSAQVEEAYLERCILSCYTLVNPNNSVHPIALEKYKPFLGVDGTGVFQDWSTNILGD